jgi:hypothetical protein
MRIEPIVTTAVTTSVKQIGDRVETARTQWVDRAGKVEQQTSYYYYTVYDRTGNIVASTAAGAVGKQIDQMV